MGAGVDEMVRVAEVVGRRWWVWGNVIVVFEIWARLCFILGW